MDELLAVCVAVFLIGCLIGSGAWGLEAGKKEMADQCADYGKFKLKDKFYECKPIGN